MSSISRVLVLAAALTVLVGAWAVAQPLDQTTLAAIRDEGLRGSQAMTTSAG